MDGDGDSICRVGLLIVAALALVVALVWFLGGGQAQPRR